MQEERLGLDAQQFRTGQCDETAATGQVNKVGELHRPTNHLCTVPLKKLLRQRAVCRPRHTLLRIDLEVDAGVHLDRGRCRFSDGGAADRRTALLEEGDLYRGWGDTEGVEAELEVDVTDTAGPG